MNAVNRWFSSFGGSHRELLSRNPSPGGLRLPDDAVTHLSANQPKAFVFTFVFTFCSVSVGGNLRIKTGISNSPFRFTKSKHTQLVFWLGIPAGALLEHLAGRNWVATVRLCGELEMHNIDE